MMKTNRRHLLKNLGISAAAMPMLSGLPSLSQANTSSEKKQRLIIVFSPNGTIPDHFWPKEKDGKLQLGRIMQPFEEYKDQLLALKGVSNKVRGDGDSHMRGISCLLTGTELFPGNIQGGSHTPAGWAKGISIDQEIKNFLQSKDETRTRFGSLEFGVVVPNEATPWTRMNYAAGNQPIAPISDPYQMFAKLYGQSKNNDTLASVLDDVIGDLNRVRGIVSKQDQQLLDRHAEYVRALEKDLQLAKEQGNKLEVPKIPLGVKHENDNMPELTKMQIDLMLSSFMNDSARITSLQFTRSVGNARMKWLGVDDGHHSLSHKPDNDKESYEKLVKINTWYAEQIAYLAKRLAETPEPGADGSMLDHTTIMWTNELGKGNSHTLENVPFVFLGRGLGFEMGRALDLKSMPHNRLLMTLANSFGHHIEKFGNPNLCGDGALALS